MWGAKFFQLFFVPLLWSRRAVAEVRYACAFSEDVQECPNFKNEYFNASGLKLSDDDGLGLSGAIDVKVAIDVGDEMCAEAWKITEVGKEMVFSACGDICDNLDDKNNPWYPLFDKMNTKSCPIEAKVYEIDNMIIDLAFADGVMCHELCAEYEVTMSVRDKTDKKSCNIINLNIYESNDDENENEEK